MGDAQTSGVDLDDALPPSAADAQSGALTNAHGPEQFAVVAMAAFVFGAAAALAPA